MSGDIQVWIKSNEACHPDGIRRQDIDEYFYKSIDSNRPGRYTSGASAALGFAFGCVGTFPGCSDRFLFNSFARARHKRSAAVAGSAKWGSMVVGRQRHHGKCPGRILHLATRSKGWRSRIAAPCAEPSPSPGRRLGRASSSSRGVFASPSSSANSAVSVRSGSRRSGCLAQQISCCFRHRALPALHIHRLARSVLQARDHRLYSGTLQKWSTLLLLTFGGLFVGGVCFGVWKLRRLRKVEAGMQSTQVARASCVD